MMIVAIIIWSIALAWFFYRAGCRNGSLRAIENAAELLRGEQ